MQKRKSKDRFIIKSVSDKQKVHTKFGIKIMWPGQIYVI